MGLLKRESCWEKIRRIVFETILELRQSKIRFLESVDLLEAYLDRITEKDWREDHENLKKGNASTDMTLKELSIVNI